MSSRRGLKSTGQTRSSRARHPQVPERAGAGARSLCLALAGSGVGSPGCCSVVQLCPTHGHPVDCSPPGLPVHHHLPGWGHQLRQAGLKKRKEACRETPASEGVHFPEAEKGLLVCGLLPHTPLVGGEDRAHPSDQGRRSGWRWGLRSRLSFAPSESLSVTKAGAFPAPASLLRRRKPQAGARPRRPRGLSGTLRRIVDFCWATAWRGRPGARPMERSVPAARRPREDAVPGPRTAPDATRGSRPVPAPERGTGILRGPLVLPEAPHTRAFLWGPGASCQATPAPLAGGEPLLPLPDLPRP